MLHSLHRCLQTNLEGKESYYSQGTRTFTRLGELRGRLGGRGGRSLDLQGSPVPMGSPLPPWLISSCRPEVTEQSWEGLHGGSSRGPGGTSPGTHLSGTSHSPGRHHRLPASHPKALLFRSKTDVSKIHHFRT